MKKILITGFEPFGNDTINPSLEAVKLLANQEIKNAKVFTCKVPVVLQKSIHTVVEQINKIKPDAVICIGQAAGRFGITPERIAINVDDFRIKDNEGNQVIDEPVVRDAPLAYHSTLPIKAIVKTLQKKGIPSSVSNSAGTFVCNHLFYGIAHYIKTNNLNIKNGFVHIPLLPEQSAEGTKPTMSLETIAKGLGILAQAVVDNEKDIKLEGGAIC